MTAEEFINKKYHVETSSEVAVGGKSLTNLMVEFAQYHVEQALIAADGEAPLHCSEGILNCYPKENIK